MAGVETTQLTAILLNQKNQPKMVTKKAQKLLANYFPGAKKPKSGLPSQLRKWLQANDRPRNRHPASLNSLVVEHKSAALTINILWEGQLRLLVLKEETVSQPSKLASELGLTPRESEVLSWVGQGKSNVDIACIMAVSPRTVGKHLERIYQKLGVENRTAAVHCVLTEYENGQPPAINSATTLRRFV